MKFAKPNMNAMYVPYPTRISNHRRPAHSASRPARRPAPEREKMRRRGRGAPVPRSVAMPYRPSLPSASMDDSPSRILLQALPILSVRSASSGSSYLWAISTIHAIWVRSMR